MPEGDVFNFRCGTVLIVIVISAMGDYTCTIIGDGDDELEFVIKPQLAPGVLDNDLAVIKAVVQMAMSFAAKSHPVAVVGAVRTDDGTWVVEGEV